MLGFDAPHPNMATDSENEHDFRRQRGCIPGILHLFDRNHLFTGKRTKRLPSPVVDTTTTSSESEVSAVSSPVNPREKQSLVQQTRSSAEPPPKSSIRIPQLELTGDGGLDSSRKFSKEAPRLSLDSRATTDAKGCLHPKQIRPVAAIGDGRVNDAAEEGHLHRSPSVVVRLMGLEPFPDTTTVEPELKPQLQRSASEPRVVRDLFPSRIVADQLKSQSAIVNNGVRDNQTHSEPRNYYPSAKSFTSGGFNSPSPCLAPSRRQSFSNSGDFFPEVSRYGELEHRLTTRGIDKDSKDLKTLKQILEALHLKGLLHSRKLPQQNQIRRRNFAYDESPPLPSSTSSMRRAYSPPTATNQCRGIRQNNIAGANSPSWSLQREHNSRSSSRSPSPTGRSKVESHSSSRLRTKPLNLETRTLNKPPVQPQKLRPGGTRQGPTAKNRSPRTKKAATGIQKEKIMTVVRAEDESSTSSISGSSSLTTSTDTERFKTEEYEDASMTGVGVNDGQPSQPSPVSVLNYEALSPSPVNFKDRSDELLEDGKWSPMVSPIRSKCEEISGDSDLMYISDILRASQYFPEGSDIFLLLEKQQYIQGKDLSKLSRLQRRLVFDTVNEILDRNRVLPPWSLMEPNIAILSLNKVLMEFRRMQEQNTAEDMFDTICGALKKDLNRDFFTGWGNTQVKTSEMVLDIERLVFKDLITETIGDLVALEPTDISPSMMPKRKLAF